MTIIRLHISALVIRGQGLGKKYGLPPTINLKLDEPAKNLETGIYAVRVRTEAGEFEGVAHFGPRPAVKAIDSFEVHCFGLKKDLYGTRVEVDVFERIRNVKNFDSIEELKKAIQDDIAQAREFFGKK